MLFNSPNCFNLSIQLIGQDLLSSPLIDDIDKILDLTNPNVALVNTRPQFELNDNNTTKNYPNVLKSFKNFNENITKHQQMNSNPINNETYNQPPIDRQFPSPKISRVIIATCSNLDTLLQLLLSSINHADLIFQRVKLKSSMEIVAIGWYDLRHIQMHLEYLKKMAPITNIFDLSFSYIADDTTLNQITTNYKFNFFEDTFDIVYLYVHSPNNIPNLLDFQKDMSLQLSKYGSVYDVDLINSEFLCFRCRFYNIRTPFVIKKTHKIKVLNYKVLIFQTIIEVQEYNNEHGINRSNIQPLQISISEWKKHQILKHRRLGSIPFNTHEIKNENKIDISKILSGEDIRVTLLIKNIPNKVKHDSLKKYIDTICFGDYHFLYLRIDFENHCNVGYAFISFKDPYCIIPFYNCLHDKKWIEFNSEKICQLAYARVQGLNNLIGKFRNSKVMSCNPDYRPRIYHTEGVLKGMEIPFPPGNESCYGSY